MSACKNVSAFESLYVNTNSSHKHKHEHAWTLASCAGRLKLKVHRMTGAQTCGALARWRTHCLLARRLSLCAQSHTREANLPLNNLWCA